MLWVVLTRCVDTWYVGRGVATCGHTLCVYRRKRDVGEGRGTGRGVGAHGVPRLGPFCVLLLKHGKQEFGGESHVNIYETRVQEVRVPAVCL